MGVYEYRTLKLGEIRLLHLAAGSEDEDLSGTLSTFTLQMNADEEEDEEEDASEETPPAQYPPQPPYKALSYFWGTDEPTARIWLVHQKSDSTRTTLAIKPNLAQALKSLRRSIPPGGYMYLWIDAICIDQENPPERNIQIQKMADIYLEADEVHIWLGDEAEESDLAMKFAKEIKDPKKLEMALSGHQSRAGEWLAFTKLMHRDWFSRRWVVQEISLARRATVHCGSQSVPWDDMEEAISIFSTMEDSIRKHVRSSNAHGNPVDFIGEVKGLGATQLVEIASNMTQRTPTNDRSVMEHRMSLEGLMATLTMFETSNPYDIVYALLWLAHDVRPNAALGNVNVANTPVGTPTNRSVASESSPIAYFDFTKNFTSQTPVASPIANSSTNSPIDTRGNDSRGNNNLLAAPQFRHAPKRQLSASSALKRAEAGQPKQVFKLEVDYTKSLFECYKTFLTHVFRQSKSLDIICRAWALEPPKTAPEGPLPSWIQILSHKKIFDSNPINPMYERVRADPLVGRPGTGPRPYSASGKWKYEGKYTSFGPIDRTLVVSGFALGTIRKRLDPASDGTIPGSWLKAVGWTCPPRSLKQQDSARLGDDRPDWFWRFLVAERGQDGYHLPPMRFRSACTWLLDTRIQGKAFTTRRSLLANCPNLVGEYVDRVGTVVWNRRLVVISYGSEKSKLFGLAPEEAEEDDIVVILYGCSVPVVLRKVERAEGVKEVLTNPATNAPTITVDSEPEPKRPRLSTPFSVGKDGNESQMAAGFDISGEHYEFVGECYVYGMMAGEGFKHRDDNNIRPRYYTLV